MPSLMRDVLSLMMTSFLMIGARFGRRSRFARRSGDFPIPDSTLLTRRAAATRAAPSTPCLMSAARVGPVLCDWLAIEVVVVQLAHPGLGGGEPLLQEHEVVVVAKGAAPPVACRHLARR